MENTTKVAPQEPASSRSLRLEIEPVIQSAESIIEHARKDLTSHTGLARAAAGVAEAARVAKTVSRRLRRPFGWHRLPVTFLMLSLGLLVFWIYWQFFHTSRLVVAVSARDAVVLKTNFGKRVRVVMKETTGSRESIAAIKKGTVDVAFIQGGVEFPSQLPHTKLDQPEVILFFLREGVVSPTGIRKILTSSEGQGSHSLAQVFARAWQIDSRVSYVHAWRILTDKKDYKVPADVDAVFVVKDPMNQKTDGVAAQLAKAGFRVASPDIGAFSARLEYLSETQIRRGYLDPVAGLPKDEVKTYRVATYLVARQGLKSRQLAAATQLARPADPFDKANAPTLDAAGEVAQGVEAVLGIVVYIGLAFLALLGLNSVTYRRRFNDLNSLVSLISMYQSSKDVMGEDIEERARHVAYLRVCSDLLGLIAVITGYYTQEDSGLLYSRLSEVIQERCSGLKINIQLKILHAVIDLPQQSPGESALEES